MSNFEKPKFLVGEELDDFYYSTPDPYTMPPPLHLNLGGLMKYVKEAGTTSETDEDLLRREEEFDNQLLQIALERMKHFDPDTLIPQEEIEREFGLSPDDYVDPEELIFDE